MEITKKELTELYKTVPIKVIMERLGGISFAVLYRLLDEAEIPRKRPRKSPKIHLVG